jgi:soluble lytic murein transglycosylase-like protein
VLAVGVAAALVGLHDASADIYSYTDKDGVVHFANRPKGNGKFKLYVKSTERKAARGAASAAVMPSDKSPERYTRYSEWIRQAATLYQIPEALVRAVIKCESDFDPRAVSPAGAIGLMQMIPETAMRMQVRDPYDPRENIFGGTRYLRVLANTFNGDLELTIAAYNAGPGAVSKYGGIPPYEETQNYVVNVVTYYRRFRANPTDAGATSTQ